MPVKLTVDEAAWKIMQDYRVKLNLARTVARERPFNGREMFGPEHNLLIESPWEQGKMISCNFTLDVGPHASGWWRNSDYDRCYHLSMVVRKAISALFTASGAPMPGFETPTDDEWQAIARAYFGELVKIAWVEPPASAFDPYRTAPASSHCYHVRVFVSRATGQPIKPEGEVYTLKPWPEGDSPEKIFRT